MLRVALVACLVLVACGGEDGAAWVAQARSASVRADEALASGDMARAREALTPLVEQAPPRAVSPDDARVVAQDAAWRLARLALADGDGAAALGWVDAGLSRGRRGDVFVANLLAVRGQALEALGRDVEAARDYHAALVINEALLDEVLASAQKEVR